MPRDDIQISPEARMLADISQSGEIRQERIEEVRQLIVSGVYETPEKLSVAVDRLLSDLGHPRI
jgi:negative regulator of flagellin synthesis FlgM